MKNIKKLLTYIFSFLLICIILWGSYFLVYGNFHKIDKDVYRSAQLFSFNLPYYIKKHKIKSILNLRKIKEDETWYKDEVNIAKKLNVKRYDYPISDRKIATLQQMHQIVKLIKEAPKPLLIHCKAGADRTSLASALYKYVLKNDNNAKNEISIVYGHFPWFGSKTIAMDKSFDFYISNIQK